MRDAEWTGRYSDNDTKNWTPMLKHMLNHTTDQNDGVFFMHIYDFVNYFETIYSCHYHPSHKLSSVSDFNKNNRIACYQFNIKSKGDYYFGVSQPDKKFFNKKHLPGILSVVIGRYYPNTSQEGGRNDKVKFLCARGGDGRRDVWCGAKCHPGMYYALVSTVWKPGSMNNGRFSFWVYGPEAIKIARIQKKQNVAMCYDIMKHTLLDYVS